MSATEIVEGREYPAGSFAAANPAVYGPLLDPEIGALRGVDLRRKALLPRLLARLLIDRAAFDGACTRDHLHAAGFSDAEIDAHLPAARELARRNAGDAA